MSPEDKKDPGSKRSRKARGSRSRSGSPRKEESEGGETPAEDPSLPPNGDLGEVSPAAMSAEDRTALLLAVGTGLEEVVPGFRILDRDLVLDEGARADLAGVDLAGRLILVLLANEDPDRAALEVLDTCSLLRRHVATIARHLPAGAVDVELEPRTVVIDPQSSPRLLHRLAPLLDAGVELLGLQSVSSASGDRSYLVPLTPPPASARGIQAHAETVFLEALPPALADLGGRAVELLSRLDGELVAVGSPDAISWRLGSEVLVRLERVGGRLQASLGPRHEPRVLATIADLDPILEGTLTRVVSTLELDEAPPPGGREASSLEDSRILTDEEIEFLQGD